MDDNNKVKKIRCIYCNSTLNYYLINEKMWQCRTCGRKFKPKPVEEKIEEDEEEI